jgi:hypothetical protein
MPSATAAVPKDVLKVKRVPSGRVIKRLAADSMLESLVDEPEMSMVPK